MKIFLITPIYATTTQGSGATPVVHYFAKEWVKQGHEVFVFNLRAMFPSVLYWFGKHFQHQLNTRLGMLVPTEKPSEGEFEADGVKVKRICLKKMMPHSEAPSSQIERALDIISGECEKVGVPDIFIGHWDNPCLDFLQRLKAKYNKPTAIVLHENKFTLKERYGEKVIEMLTSIDYIGFRNNASQKDFEQRYFKPKNAFIAYSGVSQAFIEAGKDSYPSFETPIRDFVYVGSLIARKYPKEILSSLYDSYESDDFHITYVGDGNEKANIETIAKDLSVSEKVSFTGRIQREAIIENLKKSQIFVMVSKEEIFGLVYLEAMALGLIPIGSRNEGIDGIIKDGENGFLCEAGNTKELSTIISKIRKMNIEELTRISQNAKMTARAFTDSSVAEKYLYSITK